MDIMLGLIGYLNSQSEVNLSSQELLFLLFTLLSSHDTNLFGLYRHLMKLLCTYTEGRHIVHTVILLLLSLATKGA